MRRKVAYEVHSGRQTGVFLLWSECWDVVHGYRGNSYKGYDSLAYANTAWNSYVAQMNNSVIVKLQHKMNRLKLEINKMISKLVMGLVRVH